jgi:hypothetical protein
MVFIVIVLVAREVISMHVTVFLKSLHLSWVLNRQAHCLTDWLIRWFIDALIDSLIDWLIESFIDWHHQHATKQHVSCDSPDMQLPVRWPLPRRIK